MAVIFGAGGRDPEKEQFQREWHDWSRSENIDGLKQALEEGQPIDEIVTNGMTSATIAASHDLMRLFEFLREQGADLALPDASGRTPLMCAAFTGSKRVAQKMLSRAGAEKHLAERDAEGKQAIHFAAQRGQTSLIEILLSKGGDANAQDSKGQTPLHYSMVGGSPAAVKALLSAGASASITDNDGKPPEKMRGALAACRAALTEGGSDHGMGSFASLSSSLGASMSSSMGSSASTAHSSGSSSSSSAGAADDEMSIEDIEALDPDEAGEALYQSLADDEDEALAALIVEHSSVDLSQPYSEHLGASALHLASTFCSSSTVELMLDCNASLDALDDGGRTALFWAIESDNRPVARLLVERGSDPGLLDKEGSSAWDLAESLGASALIAEMESISPRKKNGPKI